MMPCTKEKDELEGKREKGTWHIQVVSQISLGMTETKEGILLTCLQAEGCHAVCMSKTSCWHANFGANPLVPLKAETCDFYIFAKNEYLI